MKVKFTKPLRARGASSDPLRYQQGLRNSRKEDGHMNLIAALAADVGRPGGPCGLWVLAPDNGQHTLPTLNGTPIPITNNAQHTRLTSAWLRNEHRAASAG